MAEPTDERERIRAGSRRWVFGVYFAFVAIFLLTLMVEVTVQALSDQAEPRGAVRCRPGIQALMSAVERARAASCKTELSEDQAVQAFRVALDPEWSRADAIRHSCGGDAPSLEALDAIQYLRYAEENTVRRESSELASLRRQARELLERNVRDQFPSE